MEPKKPPGQALGDGVRYQSLGYTFAFSVILWAGLGWLLDRWLGSRPVLTVIGTLVGAGLAFVWVYLKVTQGEQSYRARHGKGDQPPPAA
jgi:F0F1-type ATP synthase assembly protein I